MTITLTAAQASMVSTYATESVHECASMSLAGNKLTITDCDTAVSDLYDASNSADEDKAGSGALLVRVARKIALTA